MSDDGHGAKFDIRMDIEDGVVDGFHLPASVRLRVNQNVDVRFSLGDCRVEKGMVVKVGPPPAMR